MRTWTGSDKKGMRIKRSCDLQKGVPVHFQIFLGVRMI